MATIVHIRAIWTGFQGALGYSNWYGLSDGDTVAAANALGPRMRTFFDAIKGTIPAEVSVKVQRAYQVLDTNNGNITSESTLSADPANVVGTNASVYAAGMGSCVNWLTGLFNDEGHRITGRTYLVPLGSNCFTNGGQLTSVNQTLIVNAATAALGGTGSLVVYSRPPGGPGTLGMATTAVAASVPTKPAILRSRRD